MERSVQYLQFKLWEFNFGRIVTQLTILPATTLWSVLKNDLHASKDKSKISSSHLFRSTTAAIWKNASSNMVSTEHQSQWDFPVSSMPQLSKMALIYVQSAVWSDSRRRPQAGVGHAPVSEFYLFRFCQNNSAHCLELMEMLWLEEDYNRHWRHQGMGT